MSNTWNKIKRPPVAAWHWLTSMRTALILLFLLAFASVPGALLPQRSLNVDKVNQYLANNGNVAKVFDKLQLFDVFSSVWYLAIVVLLLISLVGCIIPRTIDHYKAMKTPPGRAPKRLSRLPMNEVGTLDKPVEEVAESVRQEFKGWHLTETPAEKDRAGALSFSAEKGYLREFGNLVFHLGLAVMIVVIGLGRLTYYEGQVILVTDSGAQLNDETVNSAVNVPFCNTAAANYDSLRSGNTFDGTTLSPFCIQVEDFQADYLDNGQAKMFTSHIRYAEEQDMRKPPSEWESTTLQVNHPLRIAGDRVYLQGHGFAPAMKVTWPNGESRTSIVQFRPDDPTFFLSSGAMRFDPPAGMYPDLFERRQNQIAIEGLFAPTAAFSGENNGLLSSSFPAMNDPAVAIDIYRGDAGLDTGRSQGLFSLDRMLIHNGQLKKLDRVNLRVGESATLDDGTKVEFLGAKEFVNLQISHDSTQVYVLISALTMLAGMVLSLAIKRRRVWVRIFPTETGGSRVELGGLARTDKAGWGAEFLDIADSVLEREDEDDDDRGRGDRDK